MSAQFLSANPPAGLQHHFWLSLIDLVPDGVFVKDLHSRISVSNQAHARFLGAEDPREVLGKSDHDFFSAELADRYLALERQVLSTGEAFDAEEEVRNPRSGEARWVKTTRAALRDADGRIIGLVGVSRDVTDRKLAEARADDLNRDLLVATRHAGMAEVATGVLHNVSNVLNSVNVSAAIIAERLRDFKLAGMTKLARLLHDQGEDISRFMMEDERGRQVPTYLDQLAAHLEQERQLIRQEVENLTRNIEHIKEIVTTQQNYAQVFGVVEPLKLPDLVEDALRIHGGAYARHGVAIARDFAPVPTIAADKHKVLQILVNLLHNAKYACDAAYRQDKQVTVRLQAVGPDRVKIEVIDNGVGISAENMPRLFSQGFTTRKGGHGFGLHSGALAAQQLGGALTAHSDGPGHGATFTLELPTTPPLQKGTEHS